MSHTDCDIFVELSKLKDFILMAENIVGQSNVAKSIDYKPYNINDDYTEQSIVDIIKNTQKQVLNLIPEKLYNYYKDSDYEVYTDKYYHRMFFNEIENDDIVDNIFDVIANHFELYDDNRPFCLSLYDFNNAFIYFKTEADMNNFFCKYDIVPCTAYENKDTVYTELWSS